MTAHWNEVETFTVESATGNNNLYANGRQSIKVRVGIKVLDINNQPVALTEQERLSITLVNYHGGAELTYRSSWSSSPLDPAKGKWDWAVQNIGDYQHFPTSGPRTSVALDEVANSQDMDPTYIDFYLRTVDLNTLSLSVRITRDDGKNFFSRNLTNGFLTLVPVRPPSYRASDYEMEKSVIVPFRKLGGSPGVGYLDYYQFGLKANHPNLEFRDITCSPGGLHGDIGPGWELNAADMVGYVKPGQKTINYLFRLKHIDSTLQWDARPGKIIFTKTYVQAGNGYYFSELKGRTAVLKTTIKAIDEYGNSHQLELRFKEQKRTGDLELG